MGNQGSSSSSIKEDTKSVRQQYEALVEKAFLVIVGHGAGEGLEQQSFSCQALKDYLGPAHTDFAEAAFTQLSAGQPLVTKETYIKTGVDLLQPDGADLVFTFLFNMTAQEKTSYNKQDAHRLLEWCVTADLDSVHLQTSTDEFKDVFTSMIKSLFGSEEMISESDLKYWIGRHCPRLLHGLQQLVKNIFTRKPVQDSSVSPPDVNDIITSGDSLLNLPRCWSLSSSLPLCVFSTGSSSSHLVSMLAPDCWACLYNSNEHGLSINRFQHHVTAYKGPTFLLVAFESYLYGLVIDEEWKDCGRKWGGGDCRLFQILPQYRLMQAAEKMIYFNTEDRTMPKGLCVGKDSKTMMLQIDGGLSSVKHYGTDTAIHGIEVWGCGGEETLEKQRKQKNWERQDVEKHKQRKLKLEDWKDNPDKQLLELGGVQTEHAER